MLPLRKTKQAYSEVVEGIRLLWRSGFHYHSTIRENIGSAHFGETDGGRMNDGGILQIQTQ
jgi:hypothetical protein